jgi:hypothetical protein
MVGERVEGDGQCACAHVHVHVLLAVHPTNTGNGKERSHQVGSKQAKQQVCERHLP